MLDEIAREYAERNFPGCEVEPAGKNNWLIYSGNTYQGRTAHFTCLGRIVYVDGAFLLYKGENSLSVYQMGVSP